MPTTNPEHFHLQQLLGNLQGVQASRTGRLRRAPPQTTPHGRRNRPARLKSDGLLEAKVAVDAIKGEKTLAELAKVHDVHANQINDWKNQLLDRAASVFGAESASPPTVDLDRNGWRV